MTRILRNSALALMIAASLVAGSSLASAATSTATLTGGTLTITAPPANFSYSGTLTGDVLTLPSSFAISDNDATGSGAGWKLQATVGVMTDTAAPTHTIPAANHTIQSVAVSGITGTAPTNGITYPLVIPTAAASIFNSAAQSGMGKSTDTFATQLVVPANAAAGSYTATMTVTIISGP